MEGAYQAFGTLHGSHVTPTWPKMTLRSNMEQSHLNLSFRPHVKSRQTAPDAHPASHLERFCEGRPRHTLGLPLIPNQGHYRATTLSQFPASQNRSHSGHDRQLLPYNIRKTRPGGSNFNQLPHVQCCFCTLGPLWCSPLLGNTTRR